MTQPVEAGIVADLIKNPKKLSGLFKNILKLGKGEIGEAEFKLIKTTKFEDGQERGKFYAVKTPEDNVLHVKWELPEPDSTNYDVSILSKSGQKYQAKNVPENKLLECINKFCEEYLDETLFEEDEDSMEEDEFDKEFDDSEDDESEVAEEVTDEVVEESTSIKSSNIIQAKFSHIRGSQELTIDKIYCNYDPYQASQDLMVVVESDEFFDSMPTKDECVYQFTQDGNDIIIDEINESDMQELDLTSILYEIIQSLIICKIQLKNIEFIDSSMRDMVASNDYSYQLHNQLNTLCDMFNNTPSIHIERDRLINCFKETLSQADWGSLLNNASAEDIVEAYCCTLDLFYPNLPHELQPLVNDWLASLRFNAHRY